MGGSVTLNPRGLFTNYNQLSQVENGALLKANNIIIDKKGIAEPRRGIKFYSSPFTSPNARASQLLEYKGRIIRHIADKLAFDDGSEVFTDFSGSYSNATANTRIKGLEFKGNYYFTSDSGIKKISVKNASDINSNSIIGTGSPISAGLNTSLVFIAGFLEAGKHTAYKVSWGYKDANNLLIEGVPCAAVEASNNTTANGAVVRCNLIIPVGVKAGYFFRLYRCESKLISDTLSDEFNLVFESTVTSTDLTNGYIIHDDSLDETNRLSGLPLYSNPISGQGNDSLNFAPPYATDIALYQNHIFYANTKQQHNKIVTLQTIANFTNGVTDFVITDGLTTKTYLFAGLPEISTISDIQPKSFYTNGDYFLLNSGGNEKRYYIVLKTEPTVTPAINSETLGRIAVIVDIQATTNQNQVAQAIANEINALEDFQASVDTLITNKIIITTTQIGDTDATADSNPIYGQTTSLNFATQQDGLGENLSAGVAALYSTVNYTAQSLVNVINADSTSPFKALYLGNGKIYIYRNDFIDIPFYTTSNDNNIKTSWFPNLSISADASVNNANVNGLMFSKRDEPESVPLTQFVLVGSSDAPILRIIPLRESLFIFKTDGLFRLTGFDKNSFSVTLSDSTAILKAPDSAAVLRNQVYYFGTQGVSRVSEVGAEKISDPIDDKLIPMITKCASLAELTFAVTYETDEAYIMWTAKNPSDTVATTAYRYNLHTEAWVEWEISKTCAVLNTKQDKLYFGSGSYNTLEVERKEFTRFDYADREIIIDLPSTSLFGNKIRPTGASQIAAGDVIIQTQYLTINQYNQIITMLNNDPSYVGVVDFLSLKMLSGTSISIAVGALVNLLNTVDTNHFTDIHGNTQYMFNGSLNFSDVQQQWFKIIDRLNESPSFFYSNYPKYNRTTSVEALVIERNISNNEITLQYDTSFMEGPMTLYKSIDTELEFVPQSGGDVVSLKQFHSAQMIFEHRSINTIELAFNSDHSTDFEYIQFYPNSSGTWGNFAWGEGAVWGGQGDKAPLRTYIPARKQRSRFIGARVRHRGALESFALYGVALMFNENSDRAYK